MTRKAKTAVVDDDTLADLHMLKLEVGLALSDQKVSVGKAIRYLIAFKGQNPTQWKEFLVSQMGAKDASQT